MNTNENNSGTLKFSNPVTITNDHDNAGYTSEQASKVMELLDRHHLSGVDFKRIECFQYDGLIFKGNYDSAVNGFVKSGESSFLLWMKENLYQFTYLHG